MPNAEWLRAKIRKKSCKGRDRRFVRKRKRKATKIKRGKPNEVENS